MDVLNKLLPYPYIASVLVTSELGEVLFEYIAHSSSKDQKQDFIALEALCHRSFDSIDSHLVKAYKIALTWLLEEGLVIRAEDSCRFLVSEKGIFLHERVGIANYEAKGFDESFEIRNQLS